MGIPGLWGILGDGDVTSLANLATDFLERHGRPLRIAVDEAAWRFNNLRDRFYVFFDLSGNIPRIQRRRLDVAIRFVFLSAVKVSQQLGDIRKSLRLMQGLRELNFISVLPFTLQAAFGGRGHHGLLQAVESVDCEI